MHPALKARANNIFPELLISDNTYKRLRGDYVIREIDRVVVKGKTEPVSIYEVMDYHTEETFPNLKKLIRVFGRHL